MLVPRATDDELLCDVARSLMPGRHIPELVALGGLHFSFLLSRSLLALCTF